MEKSQPLAIGTSKIDIPTFLYMSSQLPKGATDHAVIIPNQHHFGISKLINCNSSTSIKVYVAETDSSNSDNTMDFWVGIHT